MNILCCYQTKDYEEIFRYFFELYVTAFNIGVATDEFEEKRKKLPNISIDMENEVKMFLLECTSYLREGLTPDILLILMQGQYLECLKKDTSKEQLNMMILSQHLIKGIHQFDIEMIFETRRLWSDEVKYLAETFFYNRLPKDIRKIYNV